MKEEGPGFTSEGESELCRRAAARQSWRGRLNRQGKSD